MRNDEQRSSSSSQGGRTNHNGSGSFIPTSLRSYLRIVSSGASTVASTVRSAASAASTIVERETSNEASHDQVHWAGFDKLEWEGNVTRQVLLLGYRFGFQVWDVEEANNVRDLVSRYDGPISFMQVLPKLIASKRSGDKFSDSRPLLVICADGSFSGGGNIQDGLAIPSNGNIQNGHDQLSGGFMPNVVWFYSLKSQSYVRSLKFRSVVYSVRCSSRIIAVLQAAQVHCFDAATLEREYTILTNPIVTSGSGSIGLGPLAVGPRWMAYSGSPVPLSNSGRVSPQHLTPSVSFPGPSSNGSVVAHYAKESSKQLAAGIVTLGDMGYKKISRYYSELLPDGISSQQSSNLGWKDRGATNGHLSDADSIGMVIIRDVVSKSVISQFKAHKSPISSLCFDPSGTILVTASVQGHNINVFLVMPGLSESGTSHVHLYRLQRGFTNAVIQDISFSVDSHWIMISSSRGTSHLFAISPSGCSMNTSADACFATNSSVHNPIIQPAAVGPLNSLPQMLNQQTLRASGPPVTLSAVSRIRNGNNGWRNTVTGAAVAATGRGSSFSGTIASAFHNCKGNNSYADTDFLKAKTHILVFSPSGSLIQYALRLSTGLGSVTPMLGSSTTYDLAPESDLRFVVEAIQKWNICQKQNRREREDNIDIYGENGYSDSRKVYPEGTKKDTVYAQGTSKVTKEKNSPEERHHVYISEAELQMHQSRVPLWARPEVYFQSVVKDDIKLDEEDALGGEFEIEAIPTRTVEARSKGLVPAVDFLQAPKFHMAISNGRVLSQKPGLCENDKLPYGDKCDSLDSITNGVVAVAELNNGIEETGRGDGLQTPAENTKGHVNNVDSPNLDTRREIVNNRESSDKKTQRKVVNNNVNGLKTEKQFEDEGGEFD